METNRCGKATDSVVVGQVELVAVNLLVAVATEVMGVIALVLAAASE